MNNEDFNLSLNTPKIYDEELSKLYKEAIHETNLYGKYQIYITYLICLVAFSSSLICITFPTQKEIPPYTCKTRDEISTDMKIFDDPACVNKFCNEENKILEVDYNSFKNFITILDQFCSIDTYSNKFARMMFIGRILTTIIFSYVADTYGRRITYLIVLVIIIVSNLGFFILVNPEIYLFLGMLSNMGMNNYNLSIIISVEIMNEELYSFLNGVFGTIFALCGIFSLLIMILFGNWFIIIFIHLVINFVCLYYCYYYLIETPMYSLAIKDFRQLDDTIMILSNINGTYNNVKPFIEKINKKKESIIIVKETKGFSILNMIEPYIKIFYMKSELDKFIFLIFPFIFLFFIYYGQILFVDKFPGNIKINSFIIFFSDALGPYIASHLLKFKNRKKILFYSYSLIFTMCLIIANTKHIYLSSILLLINSITVAICFVVSLVLAAEVFDCSIKACANGSLLMIANFALLTLEFFMNIFTSYYYLFAILSIVSIVSLSFLVEKKSNEQA